MTTQALALWLDRSPDRLQTFSFGQLSLTAMTVPDAAGWVVGRALTGATCVVVTSHINHLMLAEKDEEFRRVLARSELNVADGWPLVFASRAIGPRLPGRVIGIDLVDAVLHAQTPLRIAILGGPEGSADALAERERERHQVVCIEPLPAGQWDSPEQLAALFARVRRARPNLVLIGLGAPRQELLADQLRHHVRASIICCGAAIPVLGGHVRRAPAAVRSAGMEWAFRTVQSPARLGPRYARSAWWFTRIATREAVLRAGRGGVRNPRDV